MFNRRHRSFVVVLLLVISTAPMLFAARPCSVADVKGTWGYFEQGTSALPNATVPLPNGAVFPVVIVGYATFDGAGKLSGTYTRSFGGLIVTGTFEGTYDVKPDAETSGCIYSDEFKSFPDGGTHHHKGVITGDGVFQESHYMYTDLGSTIAGTAKKQ
jgi:hypothetical protein